MAKKAMKKGMKPAAAKAKPATKVKPIVKMAKGGAAKGKC